MHRSLHHCSISIHPSFLLSDVLGALSCLSNKPKVWQKPGLRLGPSVGEREAQCRALEQQQPGPTVAPLATTVWKSAFPAASCPHSGHKHTLTHSEADRRHSWRRLVAAHRQPSPPRILSQTILSLTRPRQTVFLPEWLFYHRVIKQELPLGAGCDTTDHPRRIPSCWHTVCP